MRLNKTLTGILVVVLAFFTGCTAKQQVRKGEHATIAVWDLENLTPGDSGQLDLGEVLAARVIETIKGSGKATVVERQRLILALDELNLATSSFVEEDTRLEIGKMLGARLMVFGAYQVITDTMRLDLRLVEVETGKVLKAASELSSGVDMSGWLKAAEQAARDIF